MRPTTSHNVAKQFAWATFDMIVREFAVRHGLYRLYELMAFQKLTGSRPPNPGIVHVPSRSAAHLDGHSDDTE